MFDKYLVFWFITLYLLQIFEITFIIKTNIPENIILFQLSTLTITSYKTTKVKNDRQQEHSHCTWYIAAFEFQPSMRALEVYSAAASADEKQPFVHLPLSSTMWTSAPCLQYTTNIQLSQFSYTMYSSWYCENQFCYFFHSGNGIKWDFLYLHRAFTH
jgi:hypothetical protein